MTRPSSSTSDAAWLRAMLDVEAALARATAGPDAAEVVAACAADDWDADAIEAAGREHASPVVPLVAELRRRVAAAQAGAGTAPAAGAGAGRAGTRPAADAVHLGATSQDILDTAAMLVAARTRTTILADATRAADACAALADAHRATPIMARTLLQAALPTSFGLKAAGWLHAIDTAARALAAVPLPVQMGGPVGDRDPAVAAAVAADLGLINPPLPWQADRGPVAVLAAALARLAGALAKPARDVVLLAQTEVGEATEAGGRSSAMPHKRNPANAVRALAAAHRAPFLAASLLAGIPGEHERAAGAWQAERPALTALLEATGETAEATAAMFTALELNTDRMRQNVNKTNQVCFVHTDVLIDRALEEYRR